MAAAASCVANEPAFPETQPLVDAAWKAASMHDADLFYSLYAVADAVKGPWVKEESLKAVRIMFRAEIVGIRVEEIPPDELESIRDIQRRGADPYRYSVNPELMLVLQYRGYGKKFLIGRKDGQWRIATFAGFTT